MTDPFTVGVTGAAGYTGARVVQELQATHPDWRVLAIDNFYQGTVREVGGVTVRHVDIRDRRQLVDSLRGVDAVCHLAAVSGVEDCDERSELSYEVNVVGTNNVAWLCRKLGAGLIFAASMAIFGDPEGFPITADQSRAALNWYGRTKILGEAAVEQFATGSFPAFVFVKSNLYGSYSVGDSTVSKEAVINYFLRRARNEQSITVYEPGTQSRNFVHVADVARSYVRGLERMREHLREGETGTTHYTIASDSDPSVMTVAEQIQTAAAEHGLEPTVELVENPRSGETVVEQFGVDTSRTRAELGWEPTWSIEEAIHRQLSDH
jgi:nucleoside-diphosphate-sugar epimerase